MPNSTGQLLTNNNNALPIGRVLRYLQPIITDITDYHSLIIIIREFILS